MREDREDVLVRLGMQLANRIGEPLGHDIIDALGEAYDAGAAAVRAEVEPLRIEADRQGRVLEELNAKLSALMAELEELLGTPRQPQ